MFKRFLIRDAILALLIIALFLLLAPKTADNSLLATFLGVALGGGLGLLANQLHEWGHVAGGLLGRSKMGPGESILGTACFVYDSKANSRGQFLLMSISGFIMTGLCVYAYFSVLPEGLFATRVAQGAIMFLVFLGLVIELPLVIYSLFSAKVPPVDQKIR